MDKKPRKRIKARNEYPSYQKVADITGYSLSTVKAVVSGRCDNRVVSKVYAELNERSKILEQEVARKYKGKYE